MEDPEVVAAIVAGDPAGLAEAYDGYAEPLYSYCRSMLREPADAADAVQDTFLVATAKVRNLRDPGKLRSWLYAVARNECLRRLRAGNALSALEEAPDMPIQTSDIGIAAERAELQQLVRDAVDGLNQGERDVIELSLGHGLDGDELADALGVSRNHAHAQLSRARSQLERSLGALIVARTGRQACPDLDAMLTGWPASRPALRRGRGRIDARRVRSCQQPIVGARRPVRPRGERRKRWQRLSALRIDVWRYERPQGLPVAWNAGFRRQRQPDADGGLLVVAVWFVVVLGERGHLVGLDGPARPGVSQRNLDRNVHAHRHRWSGQRLLDRGRVHSGRPRHRLALLGFAGLRRQRADHRDLNQPGRPGRAPYRESRRSDDHGAAQHRPVAGLP